MRNSNTAKRNGQKNNSSISDSGVFPAARERPYKLTLISEAAVRRTQARAIDFALRAISPLLDLIRDEAYGAALHLGRMTNPSASDLAEVDAYNHTVATAERMLSAVQADVADFEAEHFGSGSKALAGAESLLAFMCAEFNKRGIETK